MTSPTRLVGTRLSLRARLVPIFFWYERGKEAAISHGATTEDFALSWSVRHPRSPFRHRVGPLSTRQASGESNVAWQPRCWSGPSAAVILDFMSDVTRILS